MHYSLKNFLKSKKMTKTFIASLLLLISITAFSQTPATKYENDTLYTTSGFKIALGDKLKIGTGSMPDGDFKFIRTSSTSMFAYHSTTGYKGLANQANSFSRGNSGLEYKVIRIDKRGTKKNGFVYYPIIQQGGLVRYEVDAENAIKSGELVVPAEFQTKKEGAVVVVKQEVSVADELVKLKKLYDDGILTKEEFDTQKKKLLEKQ